MSLTPVSRESLQSAYEDESINKIVHYIYNDVINEARSSKNKKINIYTLRLSIRMNYDNPGYYETKCTENMVKILNDLKILFPGCSIKEDVVKVDGEWNEYDPKKLGDPSISPKLYLRSLSEKRCIIIDWS